MALPTGTISMSQVNEELGLSATAAISLNQANVRTLAGVGGSGTVISMNNLRGKSNTFNFSITSNQTDANLRTLAVNAGWNQSTAAVATINSGVTISGSTQANSTAALTINGSWPGGVALVNNGVIQGRGGNGGKGASLQSAPPAVSGNAVAGTAGGRALLVSVPVTLTNNNAIRGGGGGGGGGGGAAQDSGGGDRGVSTGSGGGGGRSSLTNSSGGARGDATGNLGLFNQNTLGNAGATGTISSQGAGGAQTARRFFEYGSVINGAGGSGGGFGAAGGSGGAGSFNGNNGAAAGGAGGGAAGQAISGNSNITYLATGTRTGPIV